MGARLLLVAAFLFPGVPCLAQVRTEFGVLIPMRDSVRLSADIRRPSGVGRPKLVTTGSHRNRSSTTRPFTWGSLIGA